MLILSRKSNQEIIINDDIVVRILEIRSDQIKVGISAPNNIKIFRGELYEEIQKENQQASDLSLEALSKLSLSLNESENSLTSQASSEKNLLNQK